MTPSAVQGMIARRGVRVVWLRAAPVPSVATDDFFDAPVPMDNTGSFGETYPSLADGVPLVGLYMEPSRRLQSMNYGLANEKDAKLVFPVPFSPEPYRNVPQIEDPRVRAIYDAGEFITFDQPDDPGAGVAFDRFVLRGQIYTTSGIDPYYDEDRVFAYALTIKGIS